MMKYNQETFTGPSFSLKNRFARLIWNTSRFIFFSFSPTFLHGWRAFVLRCFGARVGHGVHVYPKVKIWAPWNLDLKDQCGIANGVNLYSQDKITIGERAIVSQNSFICTGTHDYTKRGHPVVTAPINIGDLSWVAAEAFIHPGVTIGEGAVIGARSVVTTDMPAWTVCSGFPCKPIKPRVYVD